MQSAVRLHGTGGRRADPARRRRHRHHPEVRRMVGGGPQRQNRRVPGQLRGRGAVKECISCSFVCSFYCFGLAFVRFVGFYLGLSVLFRMAGTTMYVLGGCFLRIIIIPSQINKTVLIYTSFRCCTTPTFSAFGSSARKTAGTRISANPSPAAKSFSLLVPRSSRLFRRSVAPASRKPPPLLCRSWKKPP